MVPRTSRPTLLPSPHPSPLSHNSVYFENSDVVTYDDIEKPEDSFDISQFSGAKTVLENVSTDPKPLEKKPVHIWVGCEGTINFCSHFPLNSQISPHNFHTNTTTSSVPGVSDPAIARTPMSQCFRSSAVICCVLCRLKLRLQTSSNQPTKLHSLRPKRKSQLHQQFGQFYSDDDCVFLDSFSMLTAC